MDSTAVMIDTIANKFAISAAKIIGVAPSIGLAEIYSSIIFIVFIVMFLIGTFWWIKTHENAESSSMANIACYIIWSGLFFICLIMTLFVLNSIPRIILYLMDKDAYIYHYIFGIGKSLFN